MVEFFSIYSPSFINLIAPGSLNTALRKKILVLKKIILKINYFLLNKMLLLKLAILK
jgi:hypothetical protein